MNKSKFVALLVGLAVSAPALAEGGSFYLGALGGMARANESICGGNVSCDRTGNGTWGGFMGFMVNPYFGVEAGGKSLEQIVEITDPSGQTATVKTRLAELNAIAAVPAQSLSFYVKGGAYYAKSTRYGIGGYSYNTQWTVGAGVNFDVFKHAGLRAEYQRYNNVGGTEVGFRADVDVYTVGAYLKF